MEIKDMLKYFYAKFVKVFQRVICIFPIKKNRIICMSHRGASQYSDSPMYITEYILNNYPKKYEMVWEVNDFEKFAFLKEKGIRLVKFGSFKDYYLLNTSKVCITNAGFAGFLVKRKHQLRLNTWHGCDVYKSEEIIGHDVKKKIKSTYAKKLKARIKNQYNLMVSSCEVGTKTYIRRSFMYKGELLECGFPRNDIMFSSNKTIINKVKEWFSIAEDICILLVAPTWKDNDDPRNIQMDYQEIIQILEEKTKKTWIVLLRLHHLSKVNVDNIIRNSKGKVLKATDYPDVQELIYTSDMLITDYSSVMWDFALTGKPIVLYTPDIKEYDEKRGFCVPVSDWGLAYAENNEELLSIIRNKSIQELEENSEKHLHIFGSFEKGTATKEVSEYIVDFIDNN